MMLTVMLVLVCYHSIHTHQLLCDSILFIRRNVLAMLLLLHPQAMNWLPWVSCS